MAGSLAPSGGWGKVPSTQTMTISAKMVVPARVRKALPRSYRPSDTLRRRGRRYIERDLDAVYLVYNEFKSVIQQRVVVERLLPIQRLEPTPALNMQDYIYEPSPQALFDVLLPRHVEFQVLRALYESAAAEFGARMSAMDAATRNADEMIDSLTLYMNRVRQAAITKEIIEVVSGAEAT